MSSFHPTPAETDLTSQVFNVADPQKLGIVTGDTAVKIFTGANLSHAVLGEVWAIADKENNGFLTKKGVSVALRLIGHAQMGELVTEALLDKPAPLAHIEGISKPLSAKSSTLPSPVLQSTPSNAPSTFPPLTQQDKTKFLKLFIGCGPINGLLSGDKARDVFIKSKLSYEKLSHIWTLTDTKTRGALDSTDFIIGMYLIQASMSSTTFVLPSTLPTWIYNQAAQGSDANATVVSHATGGSASALASPLQSSFPIPRQLTGAGAAVQGSSIVKSQFTGRQSPQTPTPHTSFGFTRSSVSPPPISSFGATQPPAQSWGISAEAKTSSDRFFDGLDSQRRGYIEGDVAVPFMLESKLPESELAQIWDLADLRNDGRLTREGFAVAMHLINSRLSGNEIPSTLPPTLIPPALRQYQPPTSRATAEPQLDLLLDDTPPSSAVQSQPTGGSGRVVTLISAGPDNLPPSSQGTFPSSLQSRQPSSFESAGPKKDLLGDDDDDPSKIEVVPDNSAEIGNLRNQVASTTRSLETTQAERASADHTVTQQASQLSQLQAQLSSARASYDTESHLVANLRERLAAQRIEIQKTREELIRAESDLSASKVEKAEIEGSVLRDKEEVRELQRRMKEVGDQTEALRAGIEKAKKDARQQKGLLAIAKKQLATAEAEKVKAITELEVAQKEVGVVQKEKEAVDAQISAFETVVPPPVPGNDITRIDRVTSPGPSAVAASIPLPETPQPSVSRQSTNPFERLAMTSAGSSSSASLQAFPPPNGDLPLGGSKSSDPFGISLPTADTGKGPAESSTGAPDDVEIAVSSVNTEVAPGLESAAAVSAVSPSDNDPPFWTPPTTANPSDATHDRIDVPTGQEQSLLAMPTTHPSGFQGDVPLRPLQEIEGDDSSNTTDSDDEPLGTKVSATKKAEQVAANNASPPKISSDNLADVESPLSKSTFDDTFGALGHPRRFSATAKAEPTTSGKSSPRRSRSPGRALSTRTLSTHSIPGALDPFGATGFSQSPLEPPAGEAAPPPTIETVLEPSAGPVNTSSISDFDEALGKLPSSKDASSAFKFDTAFDDNFDFSSAINGATNGHTTDHKGVFGASDPDVGKTTMFPPVSAPLTSSLPAEATAQIVSPTAATQGVSTLFDTPFPLHTPSISPANGGHSVAFDDAFGLNSPVTTNASGQHTDLNGTSPPADAPHDASQELPGLKPVSPFPTALPTELESEEPRSSPLSFIPPASPPIRPASPRQARVSTGTSRTSSPPPRAHSPRSRAVSGSKSSSSENKSETPSRHRLTIRFPFGRKDKTKDKEEKRPHPQAQQQPPEHQQFLSPLPEPQLPGTVTPAVDDDAEPVKQLAAMGFSRTQSIAALETHGYDMQKALNSLLGAA